MKKLYTLIIVSIVGAHSFSVCMERKNKKNSPQRKKVMIESPPRRRRASSPSVAHSAAHSEAIARKIPRYSSLASIGRLSPVHEDNQMEILVKQLIKVQQEIHDALLLQVTVIDKFIEESQRRWEADDRHARALEDLVRVLHIQLSHQLAKHPSGSQVRYDRDLHEQLVQKSQKEPLTPDEQVKLAHLVLHHRYMNTPQ